MSDYVINDKRITVAKSAGFCFGVKRAVDMIEAELAKGKKIYSLGEIIHNRGFVESLEKRGVVITDINSLKNVPEGALVFVRTHGIEKDVYQRLDASGKEYVDATCPYVKKIHSIVESESAENIAVIIIGDENHPEVKGIRSFARGKTYVFSSENQLRSFLENETNNEIKDSFGINGVVLVAQTTQNVNEWEKCNKFIKKLYTNAKIFDTICKVTEERQKEVLLLARESDAVVVVGGKTSSNTAKLYEIAKSVLSPQRVIFAENAGDIRKHRRGTLDTAHKIAITAGASTPSGIIQEVISQMTETNNGELSFAEMLDKSFKTLSTRERVTGTVSAVSAAEIHVDLGTKHTGILPYDEVTDESGVNLEELFHVGDPIDVMAIKFNDAEGTVLLSKKRIDFSKSWDEILEAFNNAAILKGIVKDVINGGVIVLYKGTRVFVPASQCGIARDADLNILRNKEVQFKLIEVNEQRKRAVGTLRTYSREERKKETEEFYASLEVGQKFTGTVRSITSYGVFVNIGPVEGMVHITELFWGRLKSPAEIVSVGDTIEVYVKSVNLEKKRISLGYKTEENNPWNVFPQKFAVDDVIDVKIVNLMPFGAFAEIIPGVDGLIHNTQIAAHPVTNPGSVLSIGDTVKVKITAIDMEKKRVSLSISALLSPEEVAIANAEAPASAE